MKSKFNNPRKSALKQIALLSALLLAGGCVLKPKMLAPNFAPPARIAVLPMANESNDLRGPEFVREVFVRNMENRGYAIAPVSETDDILKTKLAINKGRIASLNCAWVTFLFLLLYPLSWLRVLYFSLRDPFSVLVQ